MSSKYIGIILFLFYYTQLSAQEAKLTVSAKRNDDKSITFSYEKVDNGTHTIVLKFRELTNTNPPRSEFSVSGYNGDLVTLKPTRPEQQITYSYTYRYIRGKLRTAANEDIVYALPYGASTPIRVSEAKYLRSSFFGAEEPPGWKAYNFFTHEQQAARVSRKGEVVEIIDEYESDKLDEYQYTSRRNSILIEHADGTLMRYSGLAHGSIKVKLGQKLLPGDELGLNTKVGENSYMVACMIYYLKTVDFGSVSGNVQTAGSIYGFVTPHFAVNSGDKIILKDKETYKAAIDKELIIQEMNKKELKRYNKS